MDREVLKKIVMVKNKKERTSISSSKSIKERDKNRSEKSIDTLDINRIQSPIAIIIGIDNRSDNRTRVKNILSLVVHYNRCSILS